MRDCTQQERAGIECGQPHKQRYRAVGMSVATPHAPPYLDPTQARHPSGRCCGRAAESTPASGRARGRVYAAYGLPDSGYAASAQIQRSAAQDAERRICCRAVVRPRRERARRQRRGGCTGHCTVDVLAQRRAESVRLLGAE
ncbi:hypothetical protein L1887_61428 [Cichorium endivia]|nr:hypothetical protein L1887_61428 [Cichorium endivia]